MDQVVCGILFANVSRTLSGLALASFLKEHSSSETNPDGIIPLKIRHGLAAKNVLRHSCNYCRACRLDYQALTMVRIEN